jgi:putative CocE/NonD family hydrolase
MTVGGWFDAEDLYGPLNIYKTLERNNPGINNTIVMGPWSHGDWARNSGDQVINHISFGKNISKFYQEEIEAPFFRYHLKGGDTPKLPEAYLFDTGRKEWAKFDQWPLPQAQKTAFYFHPKGKLSTQAPNNAEGVSTFVSDPDKPVPYTEDIKIVFTPRQYMTGDQRFAARRPDVLVFQTEPLTEDLTIAGEIMAKLKVAITGTDADWVVKLIDVYPDDTPNDEFTPKHKQLSGYQQMVRSEVIRGRYRNSYEKPEPFTPNQVTDINLPLQDVLHTFKKGHRLMIQVQSTWFPLIDRNPQKYVDNIFKAKEEDFIKATHSVFHNKVHSSLIELPVLK